MNATEIATNNATQIAGKINFVVDFDKKKLTEPLLLIRARHKDLNHWLEHSLIQKSLAELATKQTIDSIYSLAWGDSTQFEANRKTAIAQSLIAPGFFRDLTLMETMQRSLRTNASPARLLLKAGLSPSPVSLISEQLDELMSWRRQLPTKLVSELYRALLTVYYLTLIQPMGAIQTAFNFVLLHQELRALGFGLVADYILQFYSTHEDIVASALASCVHAKDKKFHQHLWIQLFFEAWDWAVTELNQQIRTLSLESCFYAQAYAQLNNKTLNERQYQFLLQMKNDKKARNKKTLSQAVWYRVLYRDFTKRTQERDFQLLTELGFVVMQDKNSFILS